MQTNLRIPEVVSDEAHTRTRSARYMQVALGAVLLFILISLGGHTLSYTVAPEIDLDSLPEVRTSIDLLRVAGHFVLGTFIFAILRLKLPRKGKNEYAVALSAIFMLAWTAASVGWSETSLVSIKSLAGILLLWLGCAGIAANVGINTLRTVGIVYGVVVSITGLACELILHTFKPFSSDYRFSGTVDPNEQGIICALVLVSALSIRSGTGAWRVGKSLLIVVAMSLLLLTQSRGALIAAGVGAVVIVVLPSRARVRRTVFVIICVLIPMGIMILADSDVGIGRRIISGLMLERDAVGTDATPRIALWRELLPYFGERPLTGYGYGAFWSDSHTVEISSTVGWPVSQAHSGYLELLLGTGFVGMLAFVVTLSLAFRGYFRAYRVFRQDQYLYASALIALMMTNMLVEAINVTTYAVNILVICVVMRRALNDVQTANHLRESEKV